jgi:CheY-like chemotaxis protein
MDTVTITGPQPSEQDWLAEATSELNNLLQIISGTSALLEGVCPANSESQQYLMTLRATLERAEKLASKLVKQAGGPAERAATNAKLPVVETTSASGAKGKKPRIMIVDDEQITLGLVSRILKEADCEVTTAQSGFECLDHFRQQPFQFDLVLLDLTMPFMDGEETFHRLRELRRDVPVVMCTGFIQHERLQRLMSEGLAGFLRKPLPPDEIIGQVRTTLAKARYSHDRLDPSCVPARL